MAKLPGGAGVSVNSVNAGSAGIAGRVYVSNVVGSATGVAGTPGPLATGAAMDSADGR